MNRLKKIHSNLDFNFYRWEFFSIAGVILFLLTYVVFTEMDFHSLRVFSAQTLSSVGHHLTYYMEESASHRTESLSALMDKADGLCKILLEEPNADPEKISSYAEEQHLSGVLVVDENLEPVYQFDQNSMTAEDWDRELHSASISDILRFPQKHYTGHLTKNDLFYDFAVISRQDAPGLILVYKQKISYTDNLQADALGKLFSNYTLQRGGMILLLEDLSNISGLSSNNDTNRIFVRFLSDETGFSELHADREEEVSDRDVDATTTASAPVVLENSDSDKNKNTAEFFFSCNFNDRSHGLLKCQMKGQSWYGDAIRTSGYTLCVFFPSSEAFSQRSTAMFFVIAFYIIFLLLLLLIRRHLDAKNMAELNRQYRIIEAIGNIYETVLVVDLKTNTLEAVTAPDYLFDDIPSHSPADQILEKWAKKYVAPDYIQKHIDFMEFSTIQERLGTNTHLELKYLLNNGVWCQVMMIPKRYNNSHHIEAILLVTRNITDEMKHELAVNQQLRESADEAKKANSAKTDFLRRMSHDIRTPINGIRGMLEIADHFPNDMKKQAECRKKILQASDFLLDLVNSVLDMNKLESGELILEEVPFSLQDVSHEVATIIRPQTAEHGLKLRTGGLFIRHHHLIGSPLYLRQILLNLAGNAVKYNRPGGFISVSCQEISSDETTATFVFTVEDSGLGMSEEFQKHLFEPFSQENVASRTSYTGTGLGLSITKELIEKMGGTIAFKSKQNVGTTFTVTLPFKIDKNYQDSASAQALDANCNLNGIRVLLVEDNELNREIVEFLLENEGILVTSAVDGQQALDKFRESKPGTFHFILMDVMMPVMDGLEATRRIRALDRPDAKNIPIFAMTANAFADDIRQCREAGMNEHLAKPLDSKHLIELMHRYFCLQKGDM